MTDNTYNGWTNYETWAVGMYLDGNYTGEGTYREALELVATAAENFDRGNVESGIWTEEQARLYGVESALQSWIEEDQLPDLGGLATDLLRAAVDDVNWRELAEAKLAEVAENAEATS